MMYEQDITVTKETTHKTRESTRLKVWRGVIHDFEIVFPPGCAGLVKCAVYVGGHQIIPVNESSYTKGDSFPVRGKLFIDLKEHVNNITIFAYNEDDTYAHTITVRLFVLPKWALVPVGATEGVIAAIRGIFKKEE